MRAPWFWRQGEALRILRSAGTAALVRVGRAAACTHSIVCTAGVLLACSCCWGHGLLQMEAYAAMDAELDVEKVRMAREAERLTAEWRVETQGARGALGAIANRILRV